jgi:EmrB/QacA subfamily drug resistance transporter
LTVDNRSQIGGNGEVAVSDPAAMPRRLITVALMLAMAVAALEQTVVATAMPSIVADLRGFAIWPWVTSAYLLAATVSTPIYGKLADLWGRKRLLLFGLGLFSLGSMLSGLSWSMPVLIVTRVIQGIGAGAVMPIVLTILGDIFTLEQRARVQGWFSAVWGVSSVAGPLLGGWLTDWFSWRWVFFVPLPIAAIAVAVLLAFYHERVECLERCSIDWPGAGLLAAGIVALLLGVLGGRDEPWPATLALLLLAAGLLVAFVAWERRAEDPVLPMDLLLTRTIGAAIVGSFLIGGLLFGVDMYVPLYVQGVLGLSATAAGQMLTPLLLTWSASVAVAARLVVRMGFRRTAVVGTILIGLGAALLVVGAANPGVARPLMIGSMVLMGLGMGPTALSYILSVQHAVAWGRRGVATGALTFFRTIGGSLGVALLGMVLYWDLAHRLPARLDVSAALRPESHGRLSPTALALVQDALRTSLRDVFALIMGLTWLGLICAVNLPGNDARKDAELGAAGLAEEPEASPAVGFDAT